MDNSMEHLQEGQSPSDCNTDTSSSQPQITHPTDGILSTFEQLCDPQTTNFCESDTIIPTLKSEEEICLAKSLALDTKSQEVQQSAESAKIEQDIAFPSEAVPAPLIVSSSVDSYTIQQQPDSNNECIDRQILSTTLQLKPEEKKKKSRLVFRIHIEPESNKLENVDECISKISKGSTTFVFESKVIPVNVKQFKDAPVLGAGTYGSVHLVTMKGPPKGLMSVKRFLHRKDENGRSSADTELEAMEKIGCKKTPYIVDYYCAVIDPVAYQLCICMEYMDTSVEKFYPAMYPLDEVANHMLEPLVCRLIYNVSSALHFLATIGIGHRDVKLANMLINVDAMIKLCDFGICDKLTDIEPHGKGVLGDEKHLPPTYQHCTIQRDMYALGMSVLEMVSGKHPFADWARIDIKWKIREWKPLVPMTISKELQKLILHLLKNDAQERPRSYTAILDLPFICNASKTPSIEECAFVRRVIEKNCA